MTIYIYTFAAYKIKTSENLVSKYSFYRYFFLKQDRFTGKV
jgi:hypothetical protein